MPTQQLQFRDEDCAEDKDLFKQVSLYHCFKYLHLVMSESEKKLLPEALICQDKFSPVISSFYRQFIKISK